MKEILGDFFENEVDRNNKYYKVVQLSKMYRNGKEFPINKVIFSDKKINLKATDKSDIGGFYISTYEFIFRWLIRGDTLCEVIIPEDSKVYKTTSENGIYVSDKIILTNPIKIDDNFAMKLYNASNLSEISYFKAMTACAINGYINTAIKVLNDKVNKENIDIAISEFENFCKRREEEHFMSNVLSIETVSKFYEKLKQIKNGY